MILTKMLQQNRAIHLCCNQFRNHNRYGNCQYLRKKLSVSMLETISFLAGTM